MTVMAQALVTATNGCFFIESTLCPECIERTKDSGYKILSCVPDGRYTCDLHDEVIQGEANEPVEQEEDREDEIDMPFGPRQAIFFAGPRALYALD